MSTRRNKQEKRKRPTFSSSPQIPKTPQIAGYTPGPPSKHIRTTQNLFTSPRHSYPSRTIPKVLRTLPQDTLMNRQQRLVNPQKSPNNLLTNQLTIPLPSVQSPSLPTLIALQHSLTAPSNLPQQVQVYHPNEPRQPPILNTITNTLIPASLTRQDHHTPPNTPRTYPRRTHYKIITITP